MKSALKSEKISTKFLDISQLSNHNMIAGVKFFTPVIMLLFICFNFISCSKSNKIEDNLIEVDRALLIADQAQSINQAKADSMASLLKTADTPDKKIEISLNVADAYMILDLQKALNYINLAKNISTEQKVNFEDSIKTVLKLGALYNAQGSMLKEAADIFESIPAEKLKEDNLLNYYILGVQVNKSLADRCFDIDIKRKYERDASRYRDSVLKIDPNSVIIAANKMVEKGDLESALNLVKKSLNNNENVRKGPGYHYIAGLFDELGQNDSTVVYLAKAAADDLRNGIKEYIALTQLADKLLSTDIDRSYTYISRSNSDALLSHSASRQREITPVLSAINEAYAVHQKQKNSQIIIIVCFLAIVILLTTLGYLQIRKRNKLITNQNEKLIKSNTIIEETNNALKILNAKLSEESSVKEYYITSFMELCLSYLEKMERFRAELGKIALTGNIKKITNAINSSRYVNKEVNEFYDNYDKAFLSLYPDFIPSLNKLLKDEFQYENTAFLTTELRIYSLIRLGIDSSSDIARFLRCSSSTVYNYRTQMRNKARDRDNFEQDFSSFSSSKLPNNFLHI